MDDQHRPMNTEDDPWKILGLSIDDDEEAIRAAYLDKVKRHPPDRDPVRFERIRDAYQLLSDPRKRIEQLLLSADPDQSLVSVMETYPPPRRFIGHQPWLKLLRELKR